MLSAALAFAAVAALLTITPGADTALVLRAAVGGGPRAAMVAGAGVCLGVLLWGAATAVGLAALVAASPVAYDALRLAGAAYLLWLGVRTWRHAGDEPEPTTGGPWFRTGLLTNLLNPKVAVFYVSFLPQFVPSGTPVLPASLLLAGIHALEGVLWFALLATATARLRVVLSRARVRRVVQRVTATVLVGFGVRLVLETR
ncbi:MAG TPA: LysE family translocator [Mycobacteriales bacterium]|nr:LysE family translocator [Mycobacteriales bacterium]